MNWEEGERDASAKEFFSAHLRTKRLPEQGSAAGTNHLLPFDGPFVNSDMDTDMDSIRRALNADRFCSHSSGTERRCGSYKYSAQIQVINRCCQTLIS